MLNVGDFSRPSARDNVSGMSTTDQLTARLSAFKSKFSDFVSQKTGRRHAGYDELNQGLMAGEDNDDSRAYGGGSGGYQGPVPGRAAAETSGGVTCQRGAVQGHVPSQVGTWEFAGSLKENLVLLRVCRKRSLSELSRFARSVDLCFTCTYQGAG